MLFKVTFDKEIHILKSANAKSLQELKGLIPKVFKLYPNNFYLTYLDEDGDQITLANETDYSILLGTSAKTAKVIIREKNEDFYDETQQIQIEEEPKTVEPVLEKQSEISQSSIRSNHQDKSLDESIEEKLKAILPEIISKIKTEVQEEVINQSRISEPQCEVKNEPQVVHKHYICDGCEMNGIVGIRYKCVVCSNYDLCSKCEASSDHPHPFLKIKHPSQAPLKLFVVLNDDEDSIEMNGQRQPLNGLSNLIENGLTFAQSFMNGHPNHPKESPKEEAKVGNIFSKTSQKKEVKIEQKVEKVEKVEPKKETPAEVQTKPKVESKPQVEEKVEGVEGTVQSKDPRKKMKKEVEQRVIENANYLTNIMEKSFDECYKFAAKHPAYAKEQLLDLYFQEMSRK